MKTLNTQTKALIIAAIILTVLFTVMTLNYGFKPW